MLWHYDCHQPSQLSKHFWPGNSLIGCYQWLDKRERSFLYSLLSKNRSFRSLPTGFQKLIRGSWATAAYQSCVPSPVPHPHPTPVIGCPAAGWNVTCSEWIALSRKRNDSRCEVGLLALFIYLKPLPILSGKNPLSGSPPGLNWS